MSEEGSHPRGNDPTSSLSDQLQRAASDLWTMTFEVGKDYVVFMDHRRLQTRVESGGDDMYHVSWEPEDEGQWIQHVRTFTDLREAAFHAFQGPH